MKFIPKYDPSFKPLIFELRNFMEKVAKSSDKTKLVICLERNDGYNYIYEIDVFSEKSGNDELNIAIVDRIVKSLLWVVGGYKIYVAGSKSIFKYLKQAYSDKGSRKFDSKFMSRVYENNFEVVYVEYNNIPKAKTEIIPFEKNLNGCRIGFDAGGSDRKVSAVVDGEVIFSNETVWLPKLNEDPEYHYKGILESMKLAASYMPQVDAIGVSSAGIYINNKVMVASLFVKVPDDVFDKKAKNIYIDVAKEFGNVPLKVANDGDVSALAGAMQLDSGNVLGIAMGTSEAVGYVNEKMELKGWLNELAFVPVDFNKDSMVDEWSGDYGCGVKYFSQDGVLKLAKNAGIEIDDNLSLAEKLKFVQKLMEKDDERVINIFTDIGIYLGYTLPYYAHFYNIKHVMLLGRVVSGKGGDLLMATAKKVLVEEFPEYADINLTMPDEYTRRVGQSIAAASLPRSK